MNEQEQDRLFLDLYTELQEWLRFSRDLRRGIETRWKVMQERNQLVTKEFTLLVGKVSNFIPNLGRELRSLEIQKEKAAKRLTKEEKMAVAYIQEFPAGDHSTTNYDYVSEKIGDGPFDGLDHGRRQHACVR